jgi:predicted nucleotidyltransferase
VLLVPDRKSKIKTREAPEVEIVLFGSTAPKDPAKFSARWVGEGFP